MTVTDPALRVLPTPTEISVARYFDFLTDGGV